jgi:hypothetical protein
MEGLKADYDTLARDPKALAEFRIEAALWDATDDDGLERCALS